MEFLKICFGEFFIHSNILLPTKTVQNESIFALSNFQKLPINPVFMVEGIFLFLGIVVALFFYFRKKNPRLYLKNLIQERQTLFVILISIIPSLVSSILIFPRPHYLLVVFFFLFIILIIIVGNRDNDFAFKKHYCIIGLFLILLVPNKSVLNALPTKYNGNNVTSTIIKIRELNLTDKIKITGAEGDYSIYLGDNFATISSYYKQENDFDDFLKKENFDIIVVTSRLINSRIYCEDKSWKFFMKNYEDCGYIKIPISKLPRYLLVKKNLYVESAHCLTKNDKL